MNGENIMQLFSDPISLGILASSLAGLATGVGALPILIKEDFSKRTLDLMLGFAAGVMLAASSFSLLVPAFEEQAVQDAGWIGVFTIVGFGFLLGGLFVHITDRYLPHEHFQKGHDGPSSSLGRVWLLVIAITIHNFPEGLAVGVSFGGGDISTGLAVAVAIGLQNMPEGLAVAAPIYAATGNRKKASGLRGN